MNTPDTAPTPNLTPKPSGPGKTGKGSMSALPADVQKDLEQVATLAKAQAQKVFKKIPALGPVVWLMMTQAATRHTLISDLEWRVMPALVLDQAKLYYRDGAPVAYASWAKLSPDVAFSYRSAPHHLAASDWNCGSEIWLVDVFTPFGGGQDVLKDLREQVFAGQEIHQLLPAAADSTLSKVLTWPAVSTK